MLNGWGFFQETGSVEAYLLYLEYKRLTEGEYSDEFLEKVEFDERENAGADYPRDELGRSGQDINSSD